MIDELRAALQSPNVAAFLRLIREGETSQAENAYRMMFGGGLFDGFADHPRQKITRGSLTSTAAGAYQFLSRTWDECRSGLSLPDFSPASQDLAAVFLIRRRGALSDVLAGRITQAIEKCAKEWASLPGSPYGQPVQTMAGALAVYAKWGGHYSPNLGDTLGDTQAIDKPEKKGAIVAPFIAAALPFLIDAIPRLGKIFGSGSEVSERNVKAAETVVQIVQAATGTTTAQAAVEAIQSDPVKRQAAAEAIEARWYDLTEAGGGGIEGARKADAAVSGGDLLKSPSFWVACLLLPLVYLLVLSLIGIIGTATWSDDVRAGLAGSLISAVIGGLVGYYYGQTTSRNRTPAA